MVDIVAIHGISQHRSSRTAMHDAWRTAAVEGLRNIRSRHADSLTLECAFYGHQYNDGKLLGELHYGAVDLHCGFESELAFAIAEALNDDGDASAQDPKLYLPGSLQRVLAAIQASNLFEGLDTLLISYVKQVRRYLEDPVFQSMVAAEVEQAMSQSPRLVVGHSLGSVIAYDWLQRNSVKNPPALLTIGSPLGLASIRRRLRPPLVEPRWPGNVRSWTNIAAEHDAVAMVKELGPTCHPAIDDQPCTNPRRGAHSALNYLTNVQTARAIHQALE
ncbi:MULTISPECIES: hypothetical protein [unclassified Rhodococcus (in: high G+C Gram-positive bacteria)]|uniref:hypothetical protein n=1 Tax=unclassified Rhodococcus (in: high G+C Gram-positive bacteria) TaxID=192944 RepID=UPI0011EDE0F7|nr:MULTISPECIES: hypothetical protein [unclassified Rhodococcus (in: high G+C Gram-positive bacteria)]KAA0926278.1 hypothetical protein FQ188_05590 [Rhodococcus sp. ANT_H53B]MDI9924412.1 hypothetical protein [Rhodococcus sp. IEGM 1341]